MRIKNFIAKQVGPPPKRARYRESSSNPQTQEEENREVIPYLTTMQFVNETQRKMYEDLRHRKIQPNKYLCKSALEEVGLFDEVCMYLRRMG